MALGVQGKGKSPKPECVSPWLVCRSAELGTVCKSVFRDSLLVLVQGLWFQSPGRALPACPSFLGGRALSCCVFPGLACVFIPPWLSLFSPGPQRLSCFSWAEGEWAFLALLCQPDTHASCLFTHLPSECLLLSKFVNSECFKKKSQSGIPQDGNKRGTAAVIGSIRTTAPLHSPQKRRPCFSSLALIVLFPRAGWFSVPSLPPSLPLRLEGVPHSPLSLEAGVT